MAKAAAAEWRGVPDLRRDSGMVVYIDLHLTAFRRGTTRLGGGSRERRKDQVGRVLVTLRRLPPGWLWGGVAHLVTWAVEGETRLIGAGASG